MDVGSGVLLIWNDIAPGTEAGFRAWHDEEHIPERMAVPGFRRGRRLFGREAVPRWLTVYEADDPAVFSSPAYRARLDAPTARTAAMLPSFRLTERMAGYVAAARGCGRGTAMTAVRLWTPDGSAGLPGDGRLTRLADALAGDPGIVAVAVILRDAAGTGVRTAEKNLRTGDRRPPDAAVLVEERGKDASAASLSAEAAAILADAGRVSVDRYGLEFGLAAS